MPYDFHTCKLCEASAGAPRFRLRNAHVWVCARCGFHYTDHLDPTGDLDGSVTPGALTEPIRKYIDTGLHSNDARLETQLALAKPHIKGVGAKVLDVGCGGGRFLAVIKASGADVCGSELSDANIEYARTTYGLTVHRYPVEHEFWKAQYGACFDLITFWDVIEHVNFPLETLQAATNLLRPGGVVLLDTPCRDAFYHRFGRLSYDLTKGRLPTLLDVMYSNEAYGHKQILSRADVSTLFDRVGLELMQLVMVHELTFPYHLYLKNLLRSDVCVSMATPLARAFFALVHIRNKMLVSGRKTGAGARCCPART